MTLAPPSSRPRFTRSARSSRVAAVLGFVLVALLFLLPFLVFQNVTDKLVTFFVLLVMSSMWNLLAGFGGLVSVGQQAYIGLGAYAALAFSDLGVDPFVAIALGAAASALIALPTSLLAFRLRGDYFAVGTWVIAEVYRLLIIKVEPLGGASGRSITTLSDLDNTLRGALIYWVALTAAALTVLGCFLLLRGRIGLALTAVRDDEIAARASGVDVTRAKRITYLISAAGCGAAGGILLVDALGVQPNAIFSVQWSAYMIFIVVIGGIGYIEGPIVGTIVFFVLQETLSSFGAGYLIVLGVIAIASAIWLPGGIWGFVVRRTGFRLFPVGYFMHRAEVTFPKGRGRPRRGSSTPGVDS